MRNQDNLGNQTAQPIEDLALEEVYYRSILDPLDQADKSHPAGTYEHANLMRAALLDAWPKIRPLLAKQARRL